MKKSKIIKLTKDQEGRFNEFIDIMEVLYAVFMLWGIARIAEYFRISQGFVLDWQYVLPSIIAGFVLIRFFFAPVHNLKNIALSTNGKGLGAASLQRILFVFDIPVLLLHSFIFYRMCYSISKAAYPTFYKWYFLLLFLNSVWLLAIFIRMRFLKGQYCGQHLIWAGNNFVHLLFFVVPVFILPVFKININIFVGPYYIYPLFFAATNCVIDLFLAAPFYLGFKEPVATICD